jgi:hypothetical protein
MIAAWGQFACSLRGSGSLTVGTDVARVLESELWNLASQRGVRAKRHSGRTTIGFLTRTEDFHGGSRQSWQIVVRQFRSYWRKRPVSLSESRSYGCGMRADPDGRTAEPSDNKQLNEPVVVGFTHRKDKKTKTWKLAKPLGCDSQSTSTALRSFASLVVNLDRC